MADKLTAKRLREVLSYDPETGIFRWRESQGPKSAGSIAGAMNQNGYRYIQIDGRCYRAHRLAWLYSHGRWPAADIDHINNVRHDNRIDNLREATRRQNNRNSKRSKRNTSGFKGVSLEKATGRFKAQIRLGGKVRHLGFFDTAEEAHAAYSQTAKQHFGEFARTG